MRRGRCDSATRGRTSLMAGEPGEMGIDAHVERAPVRRGTSRRLLLRCCVAVAAWGALDMRIGPTSPDLLGAAIDALGRRLGAPSVRSPTRPPDYFHAFFSVNSVDAVEQVA